jgi:hypothetical protein
VLAESFKAFATAYDSKASEGKTKGSNRRDTGAKYASNHAPAGKFGAKYASNQTPPSTKESST